MSTQHRIPIFGVLVAMLLHALPAMAQDEVVLLDGGRLLVDDVFHVAAEDYQVIIAPSAMDRMRKSYELLAAGSTQALKQTQRLA